MILVPVGDGRPERQRYSSVLDITALTRCWFVTRFHATNGSTSAGLCSPIVFVYGIEGVFNIAASAYIKLKVGKANLDLNFDNNQPKIGDSDSGVSFFIN